MRKDRTQYCDGRAHGELCSRVALTGGGVAAPGVMAAAAGRRCARLAVAAAAAAGVRLARPRPACHRQDDGHGDEQHEAYGQSRDWQYGEERIRPTAAAGMVPARRRPRGERRRPRREPRVREVVRGDRGWGWCRCRWRRRRGERVRHSGRPPWRGWPGLWYVARTGQWPETRRHSA